MFLPNLFLQKQLFDNFFCEKVARKFDLLLLFLLEPPKVKTRQRGEYLPNLVTLSDSPPAETALQKSTVMPRFSTLGWKLLVP
jgi:hypothetical protein